MNLVDQKCLEGLCVHIAIALYKHQTFTKMLPHKWLILVINGNGNPQWSFAAPPDQMETSPTGDKHCTNTIVIKLCEHLLFCV